VAGWARCVAAGVSLLLLGGCAGTASSPTPPPTTGPSAAAIASAPTTEPSLAVTAAPATAPADLIGSWSTTLDGGDKLTLTLTDKSYRLTRGPNSGSGRIAVQGDEIVFSGSNLCDGTGTYHWAIDGDSLTFSAFGPADPCGGTRVLDGQVYLRVP
jgi:hypothetical protein